MKKSTLKSLVAYLNGETVANINEIKAELQAELSKGEEKAKANRDLYAAAHEAVMGVMSDTPMTVADIFAACEDKLPENFTKLRISSPLAKTSSPRTSPRPRYSMRFCTTGMTK